MDRRPHWDDDLVNAVIDLQYHCVDCMEDDYPEIDPINHDAVNAAWAHEIIATVEDWHKAKRDSRDRTHSAECWRWHQECAEHLIERQRSTAQRVRDVCVSSHVDDKGKKVVFLDRIQRALDGGDAEPELDISISSYAKEADDGEVGWNDGGDA